MMQPGMMQPGMMQPLMQPGMMQPGMINGDPLTDDPRMQCFMEGCMTVGKDKCEWQNHLCISEKHGGCGRRFCKRHGSHMKGHAGQGGEHAPVCSLCIDDYDRSTHENEAASKKCVWICLLVILLLCLLPVLIVKL